MKNNNVLGMFVVAQIILAICSIAFTVWIIYVIIHFVHKLW